MPHLLIPLCVSHPRILYMISPLTSFDFKFAFFFMMCRPPRSTFFPFTSFFFFFFNDTATTEIYTLSLHDALPISENARSSAISMRRSPGRCSCARLSIALQNRACATFWNNNLEFSLRSLAATHDCRSKRLRSEEHTSELQSHSDLVCRLLLEKKKK